MELFLRLIQPFRFIARYRTRQAIARLREWKLLEADRAHQQTLVTAFLQSLQTIQETSQKESSQNAQALVAVAQAMTAQAAGFGEWMKLFQVGSPPTTSVVREADEYILEQQRKLEAGDPDVDIATLAPEFKLAWALQNGYDPNLLGQ